MGIQREWTDRHVTALGQREPLGLWVMRQAGLDREHYAEVEAAHKRDVESLDHTLAYWKRQAEDARLDAFNKGKVNEVLLKERDEARAEVEKLNRMHAKAAECRAEIDKMKAAYSAKSDEALKERNEAREDGERFERRNIVQAETIDFLQKQNDSLRGQLDAAEQEIKIVRNSLNYAREVAEFWQSKHAEVVRVLTTRPVTFRPAQDESLRHAR